MKPRLRKHQSIEDLQALIEQRERRERRERVEQLDLYKRHELEQHLEFGKFKTQIHNTLKGLEKQGKRPHVLKDEKGTMVTGWVFETTRRYIDDKSLNHLKDNGGFLETWGECEIIFTVDGNFYRHDRYCRDEMQYGGGPIEEFRSVTLDEYPLNQLVGNTGEHFIEIITKLKRFPHTAYSLA